MPGWSANSCIEDLARIPVEVDYGSEYRYRDPILDEDCAVLAITQTGETVDTLAAMEEARDKGARLWSIVNAIGSQAMRIADGYITMQAGPEIGVASSKGVHHQHRRSVPAGAVSGPAARHDRRGAERRAHVDAIARLPDLVGRCWTARAKWKPWRSACPTTRTSCILGRGINYPIALEGALKLKEISYIHAEGYPAGEMKHGPIALIDEHMPVLAIALQGRGVRQDDQPDRAGQGARRDS